MKRGVFISSLILVFVTTFQLKAKDYNSDDAYNSFFSLSNLHHINIIISQAEWDSLNAQVVRNSSDNSYRKANIHYKGILGDTILTDIGVRVRGNTSRRPFQLANGAFQKAHLKIKFNETFDLQKKTCEYELLKKRRFAQQQVLNLKWTRENELYKPEGDYMEVSSDKTQIREMFAYDLLNQAGVTASRTAPVVLTISVGNKTINYGIYYAVEGVDKEFLEKRFGKKQSKGNLYKCLWGYYNAALVPITDSNMVGLAKRSKGYFPPYDLKTNKSKHNHKALYQFIDSLNHLSGSNLKSYLDKNFESDKFIRCMAITFLLGNPDDYRALAQNYYLYFNKKGKIEYIPFDYDHCLGAEWNPGTESLGIYDTMDYPKDWDPYGSRNRPLCWKMLEIPEYKSLYEKYLIEFTDDKTGIFRYSNFREKYDMIYKLYKPYLKNDMHQAEWMEVDESSRTVNPKNGGVVSVKYYMELKRDRVKKDLRLK